MLYEHRARLPSYFTKTGLDNLRDRVGWLESNPSSLDSALATVSDSTHIPLASDLRLSPIWTQVMTPIPHGALEKMKGSNRSSLTLWEAAFPRCSPQVKLSLSLC